LRGGASGALLRNGQAGHARAGTQPDGRLLLFTNHLEGDLESCHVIQCERPQPFPGISTVLSMFGRSEAPLSLASVL